MSIENNTARTLDGLNTLFCDVINIVESIEINGDNGAPNQIILSNGTTIGWSYLEDLIENLSVSAPLQFTSGTYYDGSVARNIEIPNFSISNDKLISSTISGVALGSQLALLTTTGLASFTTGSDYNGAVAREIDVSLSNLNVSSPLSFSGSPPNSYNGTQTKTIQISNGAISNLKLENSTISGVSLGNNLPLLTANAPLSFVVGAEYNGQNARTLQISNIGNSDLQNSTISGISLGNDLEDLTLGSGIIAIDVGTALPALQYNGGNHIAMAVKAGSGITVDGAGVSLTNNTISGVSLGSDLNDLTAGDGLELNSGTTYNGGTAKTISLSNPYKTIGDRISYEDTGVGVDRWLYTIIAGDWRPNDDSTTYNIHIEDDSVALMGRAKAGLSSLEAIAILQIPYDWTPAKIFIDCRDSAGLNLSRTYYLYKIYNWGGTGSTYLGSFTTNSETSITTSYGTGSSQYSLLVKMILTATTDHLGGGYITLTPP
jgi:hypothetical protein